jgi:hypothetical protein
MCQLKGDPDVNESETSTLFMIIVRYTDTARSYVYIMGFVKVIVRLVYQLCGTWATVTDDGDKLINTMVPSKSC